MLIARRRLLSLFLTGLGAVAAVFYWVLLTQSGGAPVDVHAYWVADPARTLEAQTHLMGSYFGIWMNSLNKATGKPPAAPEVRSDKRFSANDWTETPFFDFLRQIYLVTSDWAEKLVNEAHGLDPHTRHKAQFYVRQVTAALSPSNFVLTNPELYKETVAKSGAMRFTTGIARKAAITSPAAKIWPE